MCNANNRRNIIAGVLNANRLRKRSVNLPEFKAKVLKRCEESDCLEDAMREHGNPEVFNSAQFTAEEFTMAVLKQGCKLSMDGKGAWRDNVFVERLWRSVKYEVDPEFETAV